MRAVGLYINKSFNFLYCQPATLMLYTFKMWLYSKKDSCDWCLHPQQIRSSCIFDSHLLPLKLVLLLALQS